MAAVKDMANYPPAKAVTRGPRHHFFGYYDKSPWDRAMRRMLALETTFMDRPPTGEDVAVVGVVDLGSGTFEPVAETRAWNWQQGTMLRWLPGSDDREIIFNDLQEGQFVSVILNLETGRQRVLPRPIYAVAPDGRSAVTLNFARLHVHRPGYGYAGLPDPLVDVPIPPDDGIWRLDLKTDESQLIVSLEEIAAQQTDERMAGGLHRFNHLQFNADGTRFIFLHRWKKPEEWGYTRLYTGGPAGEPLCLLADEGMTSHFDWRGATHVLAWARREGKDHFWLFKDRSDRAEVIGEKTLLQDGHCSYSPDLQWILNDTYPDQEHRRTLMLYQPATDRRIDLGKFYSAPEVGEEIRCDLHPRWSPDGRQVCFDSIHEGTRQMYVVDVGAIVEG